MVTANTKGKDFNYYGKLTINFTSFHTDADLLILKPFDVLSLVNEGSQAIEFSFNGTTVHGDLTPFTPTAAVTLHDKGANKIWFRLKTAGTADVRIQTNASIFAGGGGGTTGGSATSANQTTGNASLSSIDTKLSSQATAANQTTGNSSLSTIAINTTSIATAANQTTGNASLSTIATNTGTSSTNSSTTATGITSLDGKFPATAVPADTTLNSESSTATRSKLFGFNATSWDRIRAGITGVQTTFTGVLNTLGTVRYNLTRSTLADGNIMEMQGNSRGDLSIAEAFRIAGENTPDDVLNVHDKGTASSANALSSDLSATAEASSVTKASAGRLYGFIFHNSNGAARFLQFYNATSVPADTAVPVISISVPLGTTIQMNFPQGIYFSTGICWANSSTLATKTIGSADSFASVYFV